MVLLEGHNINMKEIEILYKKLLLLETANPQELTDTVEYLKESGQKEFAQIFACNYEGTE